MPRLAAVSAALVDWALAQAGDSELDHSRVGSAEQCHRFDDWVISLGMLLVLPPLAWLFHIFRTGN